MKKGVLINSDINCVISKLGHTDLLTIADAGLPIPKDVKRIDLALKKGVPTFIEVLETLINEIVVERVVLASEIKSNNSELYINICKLIEKQESNIEIEWVSHNKFKELSINSKAIIRTGEFSPYANIIMKSGVSF